jgi:hypothetical protein
MKGVLASIVANRSNIVVATPYPLTLSLSKGEAGTVEYRATPSCFDRLSMRATEGAVQAVAVSRPIRQDRTETV